MGKVKMNRSDVYRNKLQTSLYGKLTGPAASITAMPLFMISNGWDEGVQVKRYSAGNVFVQVAEGKKRPIAGHHQLKERELRDAFEQVDTPDKLEQLLAFSGPFREPAKKGQQTQQTIDWDEFQEWQLFMRELQEIETPSVLMNTPVGRFLSEYVIDMKCVRVASLHRGKGPHFELIANTALETIAGTIAIDLLNKVKLRKCDGCPRRYVKESLHDDREKGFCSPSCRHREWQKEHRPKKRKPRERGAQDGKA